MKTAEQLAKEIAGNTELISFFVDFSSRRKFDPLLTGLTYTSDCGKYEIEYLDYIPNDMGGTHETPVRIHNDFPYFLQVSKAKLEQTYPAPENTVLALLIQCWAQNAAAREGYSESELVDIADQIMKEVMYIIIYGQEWKEGFVKYMEALGAVSDAKGIFQSTYKARIKNVLDNQ